jgi:hypothetical protein
MSTAYESLVSGLSPSVWFKFDGTTNPPANFGSDGTASITTTTGTPTLNNYSDISNQCVYLDGNAAYQVTGNRTPGVLSDNVFSIEFWFKAGSTDTYHTFFNLYDSANGGWINLRAGSAGNIEFNYIAGTGKKFVELKSPATTYLDNKWHHVVGVRNATNIYLYVDGAQRATDTYQSGQTFGSTADTGTFQIGRREGSVGERLTGYFDELAIYTQALTAPQVNANYVEGSAFYYFDTPGTASALLPMPAINTTSRHDAALMTASATIGNHQVSNFNTSITLDSYLTSLNLENYFKFENATIPNYGDAGQVPWYYFGSKTLFETGGPSNMPYINANLSTSISGGSSSLPIWNGAINSDDWVIGIWFKAPVSTVEYHELFRILGEGPSYDPKIEIMLDSQGYLRGAFTTAGDSLGEIVGTEDLRDGQWHFAALSFDADAEELKLYHDDGLIGTESLVGTAPGFRWVDTKNHASLAALIIDTNTVLTESVLDNIYTYGTQFIQGSAYMPQNNKVSISTGFYDYVGADAKTQIKFDGAGSPVDDGTIGATWTLAGDSADIISGQPSKNFKSYKFIDKAAFYQTNYSADFSNDTATFLALFKVNPALMEDDNENGYGAKSIIYLSQPTGSGGFALGVGADNFFWFLSNPSYSTEIFLETAADTLDDQWHLIGLTKNGTEVKAYLDGKLVDTHELDEDQIVLGSGQVWTTAPGDDYNFFFQTPGETEKYIDYAATWDFAATPAEMFEMWQSVGVDPLLATNATFPVPVGVTGFGPVIHPGVSYASTLLVDPTQQDTVAPTILPMTVFATFTMPNFGTETFIPVTYSASAMTASSLFHMPQYNIGEVNSVDHMNASAEMGNAVFRSNDTYQANPFVAINATLVMPGIVTIKGARVEAPVLRARSVFALPPAYIQLTDDAYYNKLYAIHAQKRIQPAQSFSGAGIANQATTEVAKSFLKFFNDVTADITVGSTRYLTNEMPNYIYDAVDAVQYDNNGDILPLDTGKRPIKASAPAGAIEPTPIVSKGYFDAWDRKAVNITNIEFDTGTDSSYHSKDKQYSLEFTFKTTKSNQIISYGKWYSFYNYQSTIGTIGLFNGRLYSMDSFQGIGKAAVIPHPSNIDALSKAGLNTGYMLSNRRIDDGEWHHVVVQYGWDDNRTQFWIDGKLDKQLILPEGATGSNGTSDIRPYIIGYNSNNPNFSSDFQTSVWSWIPQGFLRSGEVYLNYEASNRFTPIAADPMLGSAVMSQDVTPEGNRGRALMLYWWPVNRQLGDIDSVVSKDRGQLGGFDEATFDTELYTIDYVQNPPQQYYGWDVFPVDINGYYVSDLVKPQAYGGEQNIILQDLGGSITQSQRTERPKFKVNRKGYFRDEITDARRYIDLVKDIDLSKFDAIFFRNYPDQSQELDNYARNEFSDTYFALQEKTLYEDFVKSVRAAVDTGISLYVTNTQLAVDLGIIEGVEIVPDMYDLVGSSSDPYAPTQMPTEAGGYTTGYWEDTWRNNKLRVVNTLPGLTDDPTFIWKDHAHFENLDELSFGGPNRPFLSYEYRSNGLQVGDEFIYSNELPKGGISYQAVPFAKIKAGKAITAFANTVIRGLEEIENPYKNYATSIAIEPGTTLNGTPVNGKIFVNFTERISADSSIYGARYISSASETGAVDLIQDYWINLAFDEGIIDAAGRNSLLNSPDNLDRKLAAGTISQSEYNKLTRWDSNGAYILSDATIIDDPTGSGVQKDGLSDGTRTSLVTKSRKNGTAYTARVTTSGQWFSFTYAWKYPRMQIRVPSMLTRGFLWISERIVDEGNVNRLQALTGSAVMIHPTVVADKDKTVYAPALVASVRIVTATGYSSSDTEHRPVPFTVYATFGDFVKRVPAPVMTANANMREVKALAVEVDEVVVYLYHVDPIVYLREEVIK